LEDRFAGTIHMNPGGPLKATERLGIRECEKEGLTIFEKGSICFWLTNPILMPRVNDTLTNPHTGDSYTFLETAEGTGGERVTLRAVIKSKGPYVPRHLHVYQDETFEVVSGVLTIQRDKEILRLTAGQKITLPKGRPHNHFNEGDSEVTYLHTVTPALDFEYLIENLMGLAADGKGKNGKFGLIQELVTLRYLDSKAFLADIPFGVQKLLMYTIAPLARQFGYRAIYRKYSGFEK
jgi:quercetin dioxygenase-like cupin family protein